MPADPNIGVRSTLYGRVRDLLDTTSDRAPDTLLDSELGASWRSLCGIVSEVDDETLTYTVCLAVRGRPLAGDSSSEAGVGAGPMRHIMMADVFDPGSGSATSTRSDLHNQDEAVPLSVSTRYWSTLHTGRGEFRTAPSVMRLKAVAVAEHGYQLGSGSANSKITISDFVAGEWIKPVAYWGGRVSQCHRVPWDEYMLVDSDGNAGDWSPDNPPRYSYVAPHALWLQPDLSEDSVAFLLIRYVGQPSWFESTSDDYVISPWHPSWEDYLVYDVAMRMAQRDREWEVASSFAQMAQRAEQRIRRQSPKRDRSAPRQMRDAQSVFRGLSDREVRDRVTRWWIR